MAKNTEKLPGAHGRIKYSHGRKKDGMYFADFVPRSVPTLWAKTKVNTRHFIKEYAFAFKVTVLFALIALGAVLIRFSQQASLANLLTTVTTVTQDYNSLVGSSSFDSPERTEASDALISDGATTPSGSVDSTSFNFSQNQPAATTPDNAGAGGSTGGGNTGGTGGTNEPPPPFASSIAGFDLINPNGNLSCPGPINLSRRNCDKTYNFVATVSTQNGPGQVNYGWLTDVSGGNSNGSYAAQSGNQSQNIPKSITISCRNEGGYSMRFVITAPNSVQSAPVSINHDCDA